MPDAVLAPPASAAMTQINARIAADLKARGDAALQDAGFSPTQAIRALWDFAAEHADDPSAIIRALFPEQVCEEERRASEEKDRRVAAITQGPSLVQDAYRGCGLAWPPEGPEPSYAELKELASAERHGAALGWS